VKQAILPARITQEAAVSSPPFQGDEQIAFPWDFAGKIACVTRLA
jgi:hypothetical protein